jgi:hypothetical protein
VEEKLSEAVEAAKTVEMPLCDLQKMLILFYEED